MSKGPKLYICPQAEHCRGGCFHYKPHRYIREKNDSCTKACRSQELNRGTDTKCRAIPDGDAVMYAMEKLAEGGEIG